MKIWAQQAQQPFKRKQVPNWWCELLIEHVIQITPMQSIPSHPRWGVQMGVIIIINSPLPKYVFSPPQITPQPTQQQVRTLGWLFPALLTVVYQCPLPAQQPHPTYLTPPSHLAPSARQWPYLLTQKTLLLILTTPGSTAGPCFSPFFGWMGKYPYACMKWVRQLPSTDTWEGLLQVHNQGACTCDYRTLSVSIIWYNLKSQ